MADSRPTVNRPITSQGFAGLIPLTIYIPASGYGATLSNININNTENTNYTISLYRYIGLQERKTLLYSMQLDAGDIVNDTTNYQLKNGDSLLLQASSTKISYAVSGEEYQI